MSNCETVERGFSPKARLIRTSEHEVFLAGRQRLLVLMQNLLCKRWANLPVKKLDSFDVGGL